MCLAFERRLPDKRFRGWQYVLGSDGVIRWHRGVG